MDAHLVLVLDQLRSSLEHSLPGFGLKLIYDQVSKRVTRATDSGDKRRTDLEVARLTDTVEALRGDIAERQVSGRWDPHIAEREGSDPGTADFVEEAFSASAESQSESKRLLFGRYIAHRLQTPTDEEIIALRRAMRTTRDLTQAQLAALAAIVLVHDLGTPVVPFSNRADAERWLRARYNGALAHLPSTPWTYDDLETLGSAGALSGGIHGNTSFWSGGDGKTRPFDQWLTQHGVPAHDQLADDSGSPAWGARLAGDYPTITQLTRLAAGRAMDDHSLPDMRTGDINRLDSMHPTPLGVRIGKVVLEHLCADGPPAEARI